MFIEFANTLSILNIQEIAIYWTMKGTSRVNMTTKQFAVFYSFVRLLHTEIKQSNFLENNTEKITEIILAEFY